MLQELLVKVGEYDRQCAQVGRKQHVGVLLFRIHLANQNRPTFCWQLCSALLSVVLIYSH